MFPRERNSKYSKNVALSVCHLLSPETLTFSMNNTSHLGDSVKQHTRWLEMNGLGNVTVVCGKIYDLLDDAWITGDLLLGDENR